MKLIELYSETLNSLQMKQHKSMEEKK